MKTEIIQQILLDKNSDAIETSTSLPRQMKPTLLKLFRRSQNKIRQIKTPQKNRKRVQVESKQAICYISRDNIKPLTDNQTSLEKKSRLRNTSAKHKGVVNRILSSSNLINIEAHSKIVDSSAAQNIDSQTVLFETKQRQNNGQFRSEIVELRAKNKILSKELAMINYQKQLQKSITNDLQLKIAQLTYQLNNCLIQIESNSKQIQNLNSKMCEGCKDLNKSGKNGKNGKIGKRETNNRYSLGNSQLQNIENIIIGLSQGFQQFFPEQPSGVQQCVPIQLQSRVDSRQIIYELENKIKYLQMEVGMLKKYKLDYKKMESQCEIYKTQLKSYKKKLILLVQNGQYRNQLLSGTGGHKKYNKSIEDSSLSFELSRDDLQLG